ncbi:ATP-grasp domain-containing protein [Sulfidibacter corallicola]|uniref:ATP-grasp domain-containing protein n=1 Tax=Sulfidibacter corallicola TaxID=2818388 RepID=A0A8A4TU70_SULCO|nr:ATP-grasp domain-containing protein [Sulfidibacter corallicola]QTD53509.1 ATP-grasp domain-containing protein [Sulfidibacter corallicola]
MQQTILFVGGGIETVPGVEAAKRMGLSVWVSDRNPNAPCFAMADVSLLADTYNEEETLAAVHAQLAKGGRLNGVLCLASDVPQTVAAVTTALNLPGISRETAALAVDKLAMKDRLREHGVAIPWYTAVHSAAHLQALVVEHGVPLILKPVDSRGSRGVLQLGVGTSTIDTNWAYHYALKFSPTERVMVERFLEGPQVSTESIVVDGRAFTPGFSDRNYELMACHAPFVVENGGDLPSHLPRAAQTAIEREVANAALAMGVKNGVVKGDMVWSGDRAYVIEVATRLSGGYFCTHSIPLSTGVDIVTEAIRQALGEKPSTDDLVPRHQRFVCQRYLFPEPGYVVAVEGVAEVDARPDIAFCEVRVQPGDHIARIENHPGRPGLVIATGESREAAMAAAESAIEAIRIQTRSC